MPENNSTPANQQLKINLPKNDDILNYANLTLISNSLEEFVFDFARAMPGRDEADVVSRIILSPRNTKLFARSLVEYLKQYEEKFGAIVFPKGVLGNSEWRLWLLNNKRLLNFNTESTETKHRGLRLFIEKIL